MEARKGTVPQVEISFDGEVPIPPNVRPVIVLSGSDYDMGYQYYQQLVQIFGSWILELVARKEYTSEEIRSHRDTEGHIKKCAPELIDMFKGMADGATAAGVHLSYEQVLAHFTEQRERGIPPQIEGSLGCSGFAAWGSATPDGRFVGGGCTDHWLTFEITLLAFPETGNPFICSPFRPTEFGNTGCHPGMNNKGLAYVHHGATQWIQHKPKEQWVSGIPSGIANIHTLRFANNAMEAKEMQLAYPSRDGYAGGFWADVHGHACVIEGRETPRAIRQAGDYGETDFLYSTNNALCKELGHCQDPPPQGNVYVPHGGWLGTGNTINSVLRNLGLWNMLHYYHGKIDVDFAKMVWRFPGNPPLYPTLEEADAAFYVTQGEGWDTKACHLKNAMVGVIVPDDGDKGLYYVSNGCAARVAYPQSPTGHYYRVAPTYSFYQLRLASNVKEVIRAAKSRAQYELYYANQELRKLNYSDAAYAPLDELFNQAVMAWNKGHYYFQGVESLVLGFKPREDATLYEMGKALRAFTRCQALAKQVYQALVPPPTSPEDLGLRPWGYWKK